LYFRDILAMHGHMNIKYVELTVTNVFFLDCMTLEFEADRWSHSVGDELPIYAV